MTYGLIIKGPLAAALASLEAFGGRPVSDPIPAAKNIHIDAEIGPQALDAWWFDRSHFEPGGLCFYLDTTRRTR